MTGLVLLVATLVSASASAEGQRLTIVSYNVWGVPHITPDREARIAAIANELARLDADVVALQEVWLREDAERLGGVLRGAGLVHQRHFGPEGEDKGSGLWVGSRHPIEHVRFEAFEEGHKVYLPWHLDWMADKGVAVVRVSTPAGPVDVANTHLQASYLVGNYAFVQVSQALQIADSLSRRRAGEGALAPMFVVGDLNADPQSLPVRLLSERLGLEIASQEFDIDAVLTRGGERMKPELRRVETLFTEPRDGLQLSDHPCLLVEYELARCAGGCPQQAVPKRWRSVAAAAVAELRADMADTERMMHAGRVLGFAFPALGLWLVRRLRRRIGARRWASGVLVALLLSVGSWLGYLGWDFAPYKLAVLTKQAQGLEHTP